MLEITTNLIIAARPSTVRAILLDFPNLSTWHNGSIFKSILPCEASSAVLASKTGSDMKPGDQLRVTMAKSTFYATILVNSPNEFCWRGRLWNIPGIFDGDHYFRFEETADGTKFVHGEVFKGLFASMMGSGSFDAGTKKYSKVLEKVEDFNRELKRRAEEGNGELMNSVER